MERGDLVIARQERFTFLAQVQEVTKGTIHGFLAKDYHIPSRRLAVELVPNDVVVNLGKSPRPGSVYGVEVSHLVGTKHHPDFGQIAFLYRIKKESGHALMRAFDIAAKTLKKHKLGFASRAGVWEVLSPDLGGKYAGKYKRSKFPDKNPHRFQIRPEKMVVEDYPYVVYHELGHHLRFEYVTDAAVLARWVVVFNTSIKLAKVTKDVSRNLLSRLIRGTTLPSQLAGELESDEDALAYRQIIRVIKSDHAVGVRELDSLFESSNFKEIELLWPLRTLHKKELAPILSEYATTNVEELIAESIAFYLSGKKLPKSLHNLTEKTLDYVRMQRDRQEQ